MPIEPITGLRNTLAATSAPRLYPEGTVSGNNISYRLSPQYKLSKDVMVYASYTTGYKPGDVACVRNKYNPYRAETVKSFELGIKSELLSRTLRLNANVFAEKFTDFQTTVMTMIPGNPTLQAVIGNAGALRSTGAEVGVTWRAAPALATTPKDNDTRVDFRSFPQVKNY